MFSASKIVLLAVFLAGCAQNTLLDDPQQECVRVGGEWITFSNGCVDSCNFARAPGEIFCTQALTQGCECGARKCWNGQTCENN